MRFNSEPRNDVCLFRSWRLSWLLPISTAVLGIAVSLTAAGVVHETAKARRHLELDQRLRGYGAALQQSIRQQVSVLHHLAAFLDAHDRTVDRETFRRFVAPILAREKGIQALEWIPRVRRQERAGLEAAVRRAGVEGFALRERAAGGALVPAAPRDEHFPVLYLEPMAGNEAAFGFDLASDPLRRQALVQAREAGGPIASRAIRLVQQPTGLGFLLFHPIFAGGKAPDSVAGRQESLLGFVLGVIQIPHLVERVMPTDFSTEAFLRLYERDGDAGDEKLIYASAAEMEGGSSAGTTRGSRLVDSLDLPGRQWTLELRPTPQMLASYRLWPSILALITGLLITGMLSASLPLVCFARSRALHADGRKRLRQIIDLVPHMLFVKDRDGHLLLVNQAMATAYGTTVEALEGSHPSALHGHPEELAATLEKERAVIDLGIASHETAETFTDHLGANRLLETSRIPFTLAELDQPTLLGIAVDVTESRRVSQLIAYQATHDTLTGLVNRLEFERLLGNAIDNAQQTGAEHALFYLDLDRFKLVNDAAGHMAGDELLRMVAELLHGHLQPGDTAARLGGDEFGLLLDDCPIMPAIERARRLVEGVSGLRFQWCDTSFECGVSIGIVALTRATENTVQLLRHGDVACYAAKEAGSNRIHVFDPHQEPGRHLAEMDNAMRLVRALDQDRLRLYSQPIVPLFGDTSVPVSFEILLRLVDGSGQVLPPGSFIPAAERFGMIGAIDRWVFKEACASYDTCFAATPEARMAINLSGSSITDDTMLGYVQAQLAEHKVPPHRICIEITETAAITNLAQAKRFMTALKMQGCRFALDDVGSGLSSFNQLKNLPLDYVKIAGSFVRDMVRNEIDHAMVAAINDVSHTMDLETVAEWVESREVIRALTRLGVDYAQGYALGVPVPIANSTDVLPGAFSARLAS